MRNVSLTYVCNCGIFQDYLFIIIRLNFRWVPRCRICVINCPSYFCQFLWQHRAICTELHHLFQSYEAHQLHECLLICRSKLEVRTCQKQNYTNFLLFCSFLYLLLTHILCIYEYKTEIQLLKAEIPFDTNFRQSRALVEQVTPN